MSHRPISEISQQFVNLASRAGQLQYQIVEIQKDLDQVNAGLRDLNLEAAAVKAAEAAAGGSPLSVVPELEPASGAV